jgi:diguanylate cyclase (GGDEF)-like protein
MKDGLKILVIDDDPAALALLAVTLGDLGEVELARGGVAGLAATARLLPDLILCSTAMADLDGLSFCRHLRADILTKNIPILCISSSTDESEELAALAAGAVDVIRKPVSPLLARARVRIQLDLCVKAEQLLDMTRRDPLTGIFNRRYFNERLKEEWGRHRRNRIPIAIAMVDIDHFKQYNDHYGHVKGDECLMAVADTLRCTARRPGELVARYGGEEFILLLPATSDAAADTFGKALCEAVRAMRHPHACSDSGCISVSVGVASTIPDDGSRPGHLIQRADEALYAAKGAGRDRHALYG